MTDQTSTLLIAIDGGTARSEAQQTGSALDKLTASGNSTSSAFQKLTDDAKKMAGGFTDSKRAATDLLNQIQPARGALQALAEQEQKLQAFQKQGAVGAADYASAMATINKSREKLQEGLHEATGVMSLFTGASARARTEMVVLAHEMSQGNFRRFGGSLMVLAEQLDVTKFLFSALFLEIVAGAGVIALFGTAVYRGAEDISQFNNAMRLTGGFAGITRAEYEAMVKVVAAGNGQIAGSRAVLNELVASGQFTAVALTPVARAIQEVADASGKAADKVGPDLAKSLADGARGAQQLNSTFHFLSTTQFEYIQNLERQGRTQEAAALTAQTLADHLESQKQPLSTLGALWHGLGTSINEAWDGMKKWLSEPTIDDEVAAQIKRVKDLQNENYESGGYETGFSRSTYKALLASEQQKLADLQQRQGLMQEQARRQSATDVRQKLGINDAATSDGDLQRLKEQVATFGKGQAALARYNEQLALNKAAGIDDQRQRELYIEQVKRTHDPIIAQAEAVDRLTRAQKDATFAARDLVEEQKEIQQHADALAQFHNQIDALVNKAASTGNQALDRYNSALAQINRMQLEAQKSGLDLAETQSSISKATQAATDAFTKERDQFRRAFDDQTATLLVGNILDPYLQKLAQATAEFNKAKDEADKALSNGSITQGEYDQRIDALNRRRTQQNTNADLGKSFGAHALGVDDIQKLTQAMHPLQGAITAMGDVLHQALDQANTDLTHMIVNVGLFGEKGQFSFKSAARALAEDVVGGLVKVGLQMGENYIIGQIFGKATLAATTAQAAASVTAWAPAATAASIASFGSADAAGVGAFAAAMASGEAIGAAFAGVASGAGAAGFSAAGGWGEVPFDGAMTTLHQKEMVLPAWIAEPLRQGIRGGGNAAPVAPNVVINNAPAGTSPSTAWDGRTLTIDMLPGIASQIVATVGAEAANPRSSTSRSISRGQKRALV